MIVYDPGPFGLRHLTRVHGSAVYKAVLPALFSTSVLLIFDHFRRTEDRIVQHPYAIGAFVSFFSFLLTFRLNYGYQRYWEGATAVHQMISKWLDCAITLSSFHYQSSSYDDIRPEPFGKKTEKSKSFGTKRHFHSPSLEETMNFIEEIVREEEIAGKDAETDQWWKWSRNSRNGSNDSLATRYHQEDAARKQPKSINVNSKNPEYRSHDKIPIPLRFQAQFTGKLDTESSSRGNLRNRLEKQSRPSADLMRSARVPAPSLFLQEMAHLFSLLSAVAMSTLRNDMEFAESPIVEYIPGQPCPPVDPDALSKDIQKKYNMENPFWRGVYFCLGLEDSPEFRTLYNAARPFAVLGGVSDEEVRLLQRARGPSAKVALVSMWLQEFISREHMSGSTGALAPPIISRLYQFLSDGFLGYNQARKVAYIQFPFPHGQTTSFFTLAITMIFPLLYATYVSNLCFACVLNFTTVLCSLGLHEVARELEDPFQNVPNDLPLTTFQAQFNEALVTIYAGFHPDSWWEAAKSEKKMSQTEELDEEEEDPDFAKSSHEI